MPNKAESHSLFPTTTAGSLPKPAWLAEPNKLWPQWRLKGEELAAAIDDATLVAIKLQEDAGLDIISDGEQSRQHFVHGFLEAIEGIDFDKKVEMGIRNDRYKAMCPTVTGELRLRRRVHAREARLARAHTDKKVTAQVGWIAHERRRDFAKFEGSLVTASMMFQLCFFAVEKKERMTAKSIAPSNDRKPPEIFWRSFIMRPSRSA